MDMLFSWNENSGSKESPFYFNAKAIIKDQSDKIIGVRFEGLNTNVIIDVPLETIKKEYKLSDDPKDDEEMRDTFLSNAPLYSKNFSPFDNNKRCIVNLRGTAIGASLSTIHFADGFVPIGKDQTSKEDMEYVSFLCPSMVVRIPMYKFMADCLEEMNFLIYKTEFIEKFGIAEVQDVNFTNNLYVVYTMRSYRLADKDESQQNALTFDFDEFCDKYEIPRNSFTISGGSILFRLIPRNSRSIPSDHKYNVFDAPQFACVEDVMGSSIGISAEHSYNGVGYRIQSENIQKLYGIEGFFETDKSIYVPQEAVIMDAKKRGTALLRKFYRLNENTFVCLAPTVPAVGHDTAKFAITQLDDAIHSGDNDRFFEDCIEWTYPVSVVTKYDGVSSKVVTTIRKLSIDTTTFGDENAEQLIDLIKESFNDFLKDREIDGYCHVEDDAFYFVTRHRYSLSKYPATSKSTV